MRKASRQKTKSFFSSFLLLRLEDGRARGMDSGLRTAFLIDVSGHCLADPVFRRCVRTGVMAPVVYCCSDLQAQAMRSSGYEIADTCHHLSFACARWSVGRKMEVLTRMCVTGVSNSPSYGSSCTTSATDVTRGDVLAHPAW